MKTLALLTQHDKARAIAPALQQAGFQVTTVGGFDTDTLGTFTGETSRLGSQLDAATAKARKGCELSGERFGLGSEGSFGPDPYTGLMPWARELLVWWDSEDARAVPVWIQGGATNYTQTHVSTWQEAEVFAIAARFPSHGLVVGKPGEPCFSKDIRTLHDLQRQVLAGLEDGPVWLETDMRAHRNPTRMNMVAHCAQRLSTLLQRQCPRCAGIGFGTETPVPGALCTACRQPTTAMRAKLIHCSACHFSLEEVIKETVAPSRCDYCNP